LTNYSINKSHIHFVQNRDAEEDNVGNKWSLHALRRALKSLGIDDNLLWSRITDVIIKTFLSIEPLVNASQEMFVPHRTNCFELFGFDILIDNELRPWLLEVNMCPSLGTDSPLDLKVKAKVLADLLTMVGVRRTPMTDKKRQQSKRYGQLRQRAAAMSSTWAGRSGASAGHRHGHYGARLDLSNEEKAMLRETREEFSRRGGFSLVFPSASCASYDAYFEQRRPFNELLKAQLFRKSTRDAIFRDLQETVQSGIAVGGLFAQGHAPAPQPVAARPRPRTVSAGRIRAKKTKTITQSEEEAAHRTDHALQILAAFMAELRQEIDGAIVNHELHACRACSAQTKMRTSEAGATSSIQVQKAEQKVVDM
jgi:hypothetical protein